MNIGAKKVAYYGLLLAIAMIFSYVEVLIPIPFPVPGIKLGLANSIVLFLLYYSNLGSAFIIGFSRVILSFLLFGNLYSLLFSFSGFLISFFAMFLVKRMSVFSNYGVSIAGAAFHNFGQFTVAFFILKSGGIFYYLPILTFCAFITGFINAFVLNKLYVRLNHDWLS